MSDLEPFSQPEFQPVDELYVFGDSLSDIGNLFQVNGRTYPADPPYFQGRYANGRVWVEYLARQLGVFPKYITNYARGGATASRSNTLAPNLLTQVQAFLQSHAQVNPTALYVLWIGANDYFQGERNPVTTVEAITWAIAELGNLGAQRILVANLPDLGQLPATRHSPNALSLSTLTQRHNLQLQLALEWLERELAPTQIAFLDAYQLYQAVMASPGQFGFVNIDHAYLSGLFNHQSPDQFLFWDGIHITTAAHRILAEAAGRSLTELSFSSGRERMVSSC